MRIPKGAVVVGIVLALAGASGAAEKHWDGGGYNGQWTTPANWDNDTLPDPNGDDLIFDKEVMPFTYLCGNWVANSITFNTWMGFNIGYPPDPNTLTIKTGNVTRNDQAGPNDGTQSIFVPVVLGADGVWTNNASDGVVKAAETISGPYGIEFRCDGVYDPNILDPNTDPNDFVYRPTSITVLEPDPNRPNTYSGATTMTSGRVEINGMQTGSGNLTVNGGTMTVGMTVVARVTNAGNVVINDGTLNIELDSKATASGTAALKGGTLKIHDPNALGTAAYTFALGGSGAGVGNSATLALNGAGLDFSRNISVQAGNSGAVTIKAQQDATLSGTISLNRNLTLDTDAGRTLTVSNVVSEADPNVPCGLIKTGAGDAVLAAANTYAGTTRIQAGMLATSSTGSVPAASNITLAGGVFGTRGSFDPNLGTGAGEVRWGGAGGFAAYVEDPNLSGDLTVDLNGGGADDLVWESTPNFIGNATLKFGSGAATDKVTFIDNINLNNRDRSILVSDNASTGDDLAEISGVISDGGAARALTKHKDGSGTLILSGNNTYTGGTTVSGGGLVLAGSNQTGAVTITNHTLAIGPSGSIPSSAVIKLDGGVYAGSGTFTRSLGDAGSDKIWWAYTSDPNDPNYLSDDPNGWSGFKTGGFAAYGGDLTVDLNGGGPDNLVWGSTPYFIRTGTLIHGSSIANAKATMIDNIDLGTPADPNKTTRTITGRDNPFSDADVVEISGNITGSYDITKEGLGSLILSGNNTFLGPAQHVQHHQCDPNYDDWDDPNSWIYFDFNSGIKIHQKGIPSEDLGILYAGSDNAFGLGAIWFGHNNLRQGFGNIAAWGGPRTLDNQLWILGGNNNCFVGEHDLTITGPLRDLCGSAENEMGHLQKHGSHTLILTSMDSDYWGTTYVYEGRVIQNGRHNRWISSGQYQGKWQVYAGATLGGTGQIDRTVEIYNGATLQPGYDGIGTLTVSSLVMDPNSTWDYELGALGNNDKIALSGKLYLDGTLNITDVGMPYDPCNPHIVREYVIATYGSDPNNWGDPNDPNNTIMTNLDNRGLDIGTVTVGWRRYSQLLDPEDPNVTPPGEVRVAMVHSHPGDANENGLVNVGDLGILGANYGQCGKDWSTADFTGDGCVNVGDLGVLGFNYGWSEPPPYPPPGGGAVPEPTAVGLVALGGLALIRRRRRH